MRIFRAGLMFVLIFSVSCTIEKTDSNIDVSENVPDLKNEDTKPDLFPITEILNDKSFHNVLCISYSVQKHHLLVTYNFDEKLGIIEQWDIDNKKLIHTYDFGKANKIWDDDMLGTEIVNDESSKMLVVFCHWDKGHLWNHSLVDYEKMEINNDFSLEVKYYDTLEVSKCKNYLILNKEQVYDLNGNKVNTDEIDIKTFLPKKKRYSITHINKEDFKKPKLYVIKDETTGKEITRLQLSSTIIDGISKSGKYFFIADTECIVIVDISSCKEVFRFKSKLDDELWSAAFDKERNRILFVEWLEDDYSPIKAIQLPD